jgi:hypothetical protein
MGIFKLIIASISERSKFEHPEIINKSNCLSGKISLTILLLGKNFSCFGTPPLIVQ